jgi:hypothetical protein
MNLTAGKLFTGNILMRVATGLILGYVEEKRQVLLKRGQINT